MLKSVGDQKEEEDEESKYGTDKNKAGVVLDIVYNEAALFSPIKAYLILSNSRDNSII